MLPQSDFILLDSPENILLGADFLSENNAQVDFGNATAQNLCTNDHCMNISIVLEVKAD